MLTFLKTNLLKSSHKKRVSPIVHLDFSKKSLQKINVRFFYSAYKNDRKKPDIYFLQRGTVQKLFHQTFGHEVYKILFCHFPNELVVKHRLHY